jgi:Uma2 family endonuclease
VAEGTATRGLTYADLERFPDDGLRREIIDGELFVTAAPILRHQRVVLRLAVAFDAYAQAHGGDVFPAPTDVYLADDTVVEPDVVLVLAANLDRLEEKFVRSAPDLVVEVSSPSTRRVDLVHKREAYERFGVPEYWFVDLDADRIDQFILADGSYGPPTVTERGGTVHSTVAIGLVVDVDEVVGVAT